MKRLFTREDLSAPPSELEGLECHFVGRLLVVLDSARFLLDGKEEIGLDIVADNFVSRLYANVPIYVGTKTSFDDPVEFEGRLELKDGAVVIGSIDHGKLFRGEEGVYSFWRS
jgi:hypothetical protein